jgi:thioredoxin-like negative regulator of GroEL
MNRIYIEIGFMIFIAVLSIAIVIIFVNNTMKQRRQLNKLKVDNNKVYLFYSDWCQYSEQFMPTWIKLVDKYQGIYSMKKVNVDINISLSKKFDIKSVPVIYVVSNNTTSKYVGEKSFSNLVNFIDTKFDSYI